MSFPRVKVAPLLNGKLFPQKNPGFPFLVFFCESGKENNQRAQGFLFLAEILKFGGFEKGLAGGGWRQTNPPKEPKSSPEMCSPSPKGA